MNFSLILIGAATNQEWPASVWLRYMGVPETYLPSRTLPSPLKMSGFSTAEDILASKKIVYFPAILFS